MEPQPGAASSNFFPLEDAEFDQDLLDLETTASQPATSGTVGEDTTQLSKPIVAASKRRTPGRTSKWKLDADNPAFDGGEQKHLEEHILME